MANPYRSILTGISVITKAVLALLYDVIMLIGVLSDTHDTLAAIDAALLYFHAQAVDLIVHCGDWKSLATCQYFAQQAARLGLPVKGVLGNNDLDVTRFLNFNQTAPGSFVLCVGALLLELDGKRLVAYHGHHKPTLRQLRADQTIDILLLGHTHKPLIEQTDNRLVVNPGSTAFAIPRSKDWRPSVAIVDTRTMQADLHYLELT